MGSVVHDEETETVGGILVCPCCGGFEFDHPFGEGQLLDFNSIHKYVQCKFCLGRTFIANLVKLDKVDPWLDSIRDQDRQSGAGEPKKGHF